MGLKLLTKKRNRTIKMAICGLGRFAEKRLLPAIQNVDGIELVAVVANKIENINISPKIEKFTNLDEMLKSKDLDVVHISTPNSLHYKQTLECFKHSKDVICEKPLSTTFKNAKNMLSMAKLEKCHLLVAHMLRASPAILRIKEIIESGYVGALLKIKIELNYNVDPILRKWLWNSKIAGGGCVIDSGVHCIDVAQFLTEKDWTLSKKNLKKNEYDIETNAKIILSSKAVKCEININSNTSYSSSLEIIGEECTILVNNFSASWGSSEFEFLDNDKKVFNKFFVDVSSVYKNQYDNFFKILSKRDFNHSVTNDAIKSLKIIEEIYHL